MLNLYSYSMHFFRAFDRTSRPMRGIVHQMSEQRRYMTVDANVTAPKPFHSIPGPLSLPFIGHLHLFSKYGPYSFERLQDAFDDLHKKYGDILRVNLGVKMVLLFRPEDLEAIYASELHYPSRPVFEALKYCRKNAFGGTLGFSCAGLVTENGEDWERLRKAVNSMMKPSFAHGYFHLHEKVAEDFVHYVKLKKNSKGEITDFLRDIYRYTAEGIGLVCFGKRIGLVDSPSFRSSECNIFSEAADDTLQGLADTLLGFPWWKYFNTESFQKLENSQEFFLRYSSQSMLEALQKLADQNCKDDGELSFLKLLISNKDLGADKYLLMTEIFSAGIDATGNTIGFMLYHLSKRPDVQEKLYQEIVENTSKGPLTPEKLSNMRFLKACFVESNRLTPTTGGNARILTKPIVLSGYQIPAKVLCVAQNPLMCRDERFFDKPLEYLPERWYVDSSSRLRKISHPYLILPFSHGKRRCVGQRIAEQEIKLLIVKMISKFRIEYCGQEIGNIMRMSLIPDKKLNFNFKER